MKKILFLLAALLCSIPLSAELKVKEGSWKSASAANREAENGSMGVTNITADLIEWPTNVDGDDDNALVIVRFENMSPDDIKNTKASINHGIASKTDYKEVGGVLKAFYYLPASNRAEITLSHGRFGSVKLPTQKIDVHGIYEVEVINSGIVSVSITSEPAGATVIFDGVEQFGKTPLTIPDVNLGQHNIALRPENLEMANSIPQQVIYVTTSQAAFNFDMVKHRDLIIETTPYDATIEIKLNDKLIESGQGRVKLTDIPYGRTYSVVAFTNEGRIKENIFIDNNTPEKIMYKVNGSKNVAFFAKQNNEIVQGARVMVDGSYIGTTPVDKLLDYGTYKVQMAYDGYTKEGTLKLNAKSKGNYQLRLPNKKQTSFNPFDVDYRRRAWGINFSYIHEYEPNDKADPGILVGISYQPYFGYGQGLNTGLYYKGVFGQDDWNEDESSTRSALFVPLQYQFRLPLHRNFSVAINAGTGLTYSLKSKNSNTNSESADFSAARFDCSFLVGAAIQFKALQIEGKYSKNLTGVDLDGSGDKFKGRMYILGLSLLF